MSSDEQYSNPVKNNATALFKKIEDRFVVNKTIYSKKKGTWDKNLQEKVFMNEIETHLRKHPDLEFDKIGKAISNRDLSATFPIHFKIRS